MLHCNFYNTATKAKGEVLCEALTHCGSRLRLCIVDKINGAVDIINFYFEPTHLSISVNTADLISIQSA